jgi:hypothetical protein
MFYYNTELQVAVGLYGSYTRTVVMGWAKKMSL